MQAGGQGHLLLSTAALVARLLHQGLALVSAARMLGRAATGGCQTGDRLR